MNKYIYINGYIDIEYFTKETILISKAPYKRYLRL